MSQTNITLTVTALGMVAYGVYAMKNHKTIKADKILVFAMWCGAIVTGGYMLVSAFVLSKQPGQETNALYLGIFGVYMSLLSLQKVYELLKELTLKQSKVSPAQLTEKRTPEDS